MKAPALTDLVTFKALAEDGTEEAQFCSPFFLHSTFDGSEQQMKVLFGNEKKGRGVVLKNCFQIPIDQTSSLHQLILSYHSF